MSVTSCHHGNLTDRTVFTRSQWILQSQQFYFTFDEMEFLQREKNEQVHMEDRISHKSVWNNKQWQEIEFFNLFCEHMLAFYSANTKFIPYNLTKDFFKKQKTRAQQLMKSSVVNAFKLIRFLCNPSTTPDKTWWKFVELSQICKVFPIFASLIFFLH